LGATFPRALTIPSLTDLPFFPGILFAVVVAAIIFFTERPRPLAMAVLIVLVIAAWLCAYNVAQHPGIVGLSGTANAPENWSGTYTGIVMGLISGCVGSAITCLAVSVAAPSFRSLGNWARTIAIGTLAGSLLQFAVSDSGALGFNVLFIVWQCAVAASIAYGVRPRTI
jgi:hypothetical protein